MCRRERDAQIFSSIKEWDLENLKNSIGIDKKTNYIKSLEARKIEFERRNEKTPNSIGNKHKKWRLKADIE